MGVTSEPEIFSHALDTKDAFIILASDGVWEFVDSQNAVNIVGAASTAEEGCRQVTTASGNIEQEAVQTPRSYEMWYWYRAAFLVSFKRSISFDRSQEDVLHDCKQAWTQEELTVCCSNAEFAVGAAIKFHSTTGWSSLLIRAAGLEGDWKEIDYIHNWLCPL